MNLPVAATTTLCTLFLIFAYGKYQHHVGWAEGVADLEQKMVREAQAKLEKQITRQQADDVKASAAETAGKEKAEVITRDVIKYIKIPNRNTCTFDAERVRIKSASVDNTNNIAGFDDPAVQTSSAVK